MKPTIFLSCLVVIFGCLMWTASARKDNAFTNEKTRMLNIFGVPGVHDVTKKRNLPALINFLERYSRRLNLTPDEQLSANNAVRKYREEEAKQLKIEGAHPQGGFPTDCHIYIQDIIPWILKYLQQTN